MEIFHYISVFVPLALLIGVPAYLKSLDIKEQSHCWILYTACLLFFISWYLPSPLIHGEDTSFTTHFVGGGIFTGLLWVYLKNSFQWKTSWIVEMISLFVLVCTLGVINELAELFMMEFGIADITLSDTSWDILANTLGALSLYLVYKLTRVGYDTRH